MMIHEFTFADITGGMTDGIAVLDDILSGGDVAEGKLVASGNVGQVLQGHSHRIGGIDLKKLLQRINVLTISKYYKLSTVLIMPRSKMLWMLSVRRSVRPGIALRSPCSCQMRS